MRFADIDADKLDFVAIAAFEFFQDPKLGSIRPSGEAAEDQHHRLLAAKLRESEDLAFVIMSRQRKIGSEAANLRPFMKRTDFALEQSF